nr:MAG TPA: hypothetical protein [Crassvirales sp.]
MIKFFKDFEPSTKEEFLEMYKEKWGDNLDKATVFLANLEFPNAHNIKLYFSKDSSIFTIDIFDDWNSDFRFKVTFRKEACHITLENGNYYISHLQEVCDKIKFLYQILT